MNNTILKFFDKYLKEIEVKGKRVLEVGSQNINGSVRLGIMRLEPREYIGVDIVQKQGVDLILNAKELVNHFGEDSFDVLASTEMIEREEEWKTVIDNFKRVLKPGGVIMLSARSMGVAKRKQDYWRYGIQDMNEIFSDFQMHMIGGDSLTPGIVMKAIKPKMWVTNVLSEYKLYSVVCEQRI